LFVASERALLGLREVVKSCAQTRQRPNIPIIALSANAVPRDIANGLEAGFLNYLTKPIKVNEFMDALDVALNFSRTAPDRAAGKGQA
jgi:CheY-like chemotaxis protein